MRVLRPPGGATRAVLLVVILYLTTVSHLAQYDVGIARNWITGELSLMGPGGFYFTPPWVFVAHIDSRPQRLCVTTTAHAAITCRLVEFVPSAYQEFIAVEGFRLYWWSNRFSFNSGYNEEYRGQRDVLRGYAFSAKQYPFLKLLREYQE